MTKLDPDLARALIEKRIRDLGLTPLPECNMQMAVEELAEKGSQSEIFKQTLKEILQ